MFILTTYDFLHFNFDFGTWNDNLDDWHLPQSLGETIPNEMKLIFKSMEIEKTNGTENTSWLFQTVT